MNSSSEHCGCLSCWDLDGFLLFPLKNLNPELAADSMRIDSARLDPVSSVTSPSLEDDFSGFLASQF